MSLRPIEEPVAVSPLRSELDEARAVTLEQQRATAVPAEVLYAPELANLNHDERQVVTLGVSPDAWRPISLMNTAHYSQLLQSNAIAGPLAAKLESYKAVSGQ